MDALPELLQRAVTTHQAGDLTEAALLYKAVLNTHPDHFDALHLLGLIEYQQARPEEATRLISLALKANPRSEQALSHQGLALHALERFEDALASFDRALAINPDYTEALVNRGNTLRELKRPDDALADYDRALALKPDYFVALNNRGNTLRELKRLEEALQSYKQALALKPDYLDALNNCGNALRDLNRMEEALARYDQALALEPDYLEALTNRGNILRDLGRMDEALRDYGKALALKPNHAETHWNESIARLLLGDFKTGWEKFEWRWRNNAFTSPLRDFPSPLWRGDEPIAGKTILLHAEQGLGDTIQFCRYAKRVAGQGATVLLEVQPELKLLLSGVAGVSRILAKGEAPPPFDFHCPLLSLPLAFNTSLETIPADIPYLHVDEKLLQYWQDRLGKRDIPRIGLVWSGNARHINDRNRSIALEKFMCLMSQDVQLVSLQKEVDAESRKVLDQNPHILHFGDDLKSFSETAALIQSMDLVISVDTSVAHLAGALGKPVWILLPFAPDWRWLLGREDSPWYPTARLFRQSGPGDWDSVFGKINNELAARFTNTKVILPEVNLETDFTRWSNPDSLSEAWDSRAQVVSQFIPDGAKVLDIGCGKMALERYLPPNCRYLPSDLVKRDERTVVCDLNKGEFPDAVAGKADFITLLGVVEYVMDVPKFFNLLRQTGKPIIITYHPTDITGHLDRAELGWLNHYSIAQWAELILSAGLQVDNIEKLSDIQILFKLSPKKNQEVTPKRVAVLSYANVGNFGDRLGYHLLQSVLPPAAEVEHHFFQPWAMPDMRNVDLLVLGIGNSLFQPLLTDELQALLESSPCTIGIFGTQYRANIDRKRMNAVLGRLHTWYARYEEDILIYGEHAPNVVHLGDWLIDAFPMARPHLDTPLSIGQEVWQELPLDRTIQEIQKYKTVVSTRLHPLLCALTSAQSVQYAEQRESGTQEVSGKFRSMLMDVFGRTYPEGALWDVDRQKVMRYKQMVGDRKVELSANIHQLLGC